MVDPRIYRALLVLVAFAVIVFGFSLQNQPRGIGTSLAPGQFFESAPSLMTSLAGRDPAPKPGGEEDNRLATYVKTALDRVKVNNVSVFQVSTQQFSAHTVQGPEILTNVIAYRPGLANGEVVVVAPRDAAPGRARFNAQANMSATAVLLSLAGALAGETLNRSVMLVSTSGQVGAAGATALAQSLSSQPVDAVIVLGDLAGARHRTPVIVPWSAGQTLAPPLLRNTLAAFVSQQSGIPVGGSGLAGQFVRLAVPFSLTEQAPFIDAGIPAVLLSVSGDMPTPSDASVPDATSAGLTATSAQVTALGTAVLQTVDALDQGPAVPAPSSYLVLSGKLVPLWAVRLLVLALILPVAVTAVDALARTRRRGHSLLRWVAWVLCGAVPFLVGVVALLLARVANLFSASPPGAVAGNAVPLTGGDTAVLVVLLVVMILAFVFLRPLCLRLIASALGGGRAGDQRRYPESPPADAAAVALTLVMCVVTLVIWALNPFSALLLVPALHLWLWLAQPGMRAHRWAVLLLTLAAALPIVAVLIYYANAYGLTPVGLIWSGALMISGGAMPVVAALYWALALGCLASALVIAVRSVRAATAAAADTVLSVRGPASYAGPGSLGGTESALRR